MNSLRLAQRLKGSSPKGQSSRKLDLVWSVVDTMIRSRFIRHWTISIGYPCRWSMRRYIMLKWKKRCNKSVHRKRVFQSYKFSENLGKPEIMRRLEMSETAKKSARGAFADENLLAEAGHVWVLLLNLLTVTCSFFDSYMRSLPLGGLQSCIVSVSAFTLVVEISSTPNCTLTRVRSSPFQRFNLYWIEVSRYVDETKCSWLSLSTVKSESTLVVLLGDDATWQSEIVAPRIREWVERDPWKR